MQEVGRLTMTEAQQRWQQALSSRTEADDCWKQQTEHADSLSFPTYHLRYQLVMAEKTAGTYFCHYELMPCAEAGKSRMLAGC